MTAPTPEQIMDYINLNIVENGVENVRATHLRTAIRMLAEYSVSIDPGVSLPSNIQALLDSKAAKTTSIAGDGLAAGGGTLELNRTISVAAATQEEAEAGAINTRAMMPLRVKQEVLALAADPAFAAAFALALFKALPQLDVGDPRPWDTVIINGTFVELTPEEPTP